MLTRSGFVGIKILLAPFGAIPGRFSLDRNNQKNISYFLPIFLGGPMGPITRFGPLLLSTRGGEIGIDTDASHQKLAIPALWA